MWLEHCSTDLHCPQLWHNSRALWGLLVCWCFVPAWVSCMSFISPCSLANVRKHARWQQWIKWYHCRQEWHQIEFLDKFRFCLLKMMAAFWFPAGKGSGNNVTEFTWDIWCLLTLWWTVTCSRTLSAQHPRCHFLARQGTTTKPHVAVWTFALVSQDVKPGLDHQITTLVDNQKCLGYGEMMCAALWPNFTHHRWPMEPGECSMDGYTTGWHLCPIHVTVITHGKSSQGPWWTLCLMGNKICWTKVTIML